MPAELRVKLQPANLQESQIESLIEEPELAQFAVRLTDTNRKLAKTVINWITGELTKLVSESTVLWSEVTAAQQQLLKLAHMVKTGQLSSTGAKELLVDVVKAQRDPKPLAQEKNLLQVSDESAIEKIVAEVLAENEKAANDVRNGEMKAIGFLVGQVMAKSKGKIVMLDCGGRDDHIP